MKSAHRTLSLFVVSLAAIPILLSAPCFAQVNPAEIRNPGLKAMEQAYLPKLMALNRDIARIKFPFALSLNRYAGLDPKEQVGADARALEFVDFHGRSVLKLTANYNAAYNADALSPNQRSASVFNEVVVPILKLLPNYFTTGEDFDAFGFEVAYHVRRQFHNYEYEGKEILAAVMDKADALSYANQQQDSERQEALNRSDIYLSGEPFGLALASRDPLIVETLARSFRNKRTPASDARGGAAMATAGGQSSQSIRMTSFIPATTVSSPAAPARADKQPAAPPLTQADADRLQVKYQPQLDILGKEGVAKFHFVDYASPSFLIFQNQVFLQLTLRNVISFDPDASSIYKRAARSFDLFFAPQLKGIMEKVPDSSECKGLDVTIINELAPKSGHASEALEIVFPLDALRQFADARITNQQLIDQSVVIVNGVRIALNLQQVE